MDLCHLNVSHCLNNGICAVNYLLNTTYCLCGPCHEGDLCEKILPRQKKYNTKYVFLIIYCFGFCISVLNNCMSLELFFRCKAIRRTNCGVYLIIYSILALLASSLLVADGVVEYDNSIFGGNPYAHNTFHCVVGVAGYNTAVFCVYGLVQVFSLNRVYLPTAVLRRTPHESNPSSFRQPCLLWA